MRAASLSQYDHGWATEAVGADVPVVPQRALPEMVEPVAQPDGPGGGGEPLVAVEHRRVRVMSCYWHAGWPSAGPGAWLRRPVAHSLYAAAESLDDGFGLAVLDAWRPLALQREIYLAAYADSSLPAGFVSEPSEDPATPPPHLTGGTVDVTLTWQGRPLALGTPFDDFTSAAHTSALEGVVCTERELRRLLYWTMRDQGFVVVDCEWWHFESGTRRWAALTGQAPLYGPAELAGQPGPGSRPRRADQT